MWFSLKLGFRAFLGISRKNWDFMQNIWISEWVPMLKSLKMREIPIFAKFKYLEKHMGRALREICEKTGPNNHTGKI